MCDYSLMAIPNRLAVSGEELVVHKFEEGSVGLASPCDLRKRQQYRKVQCHGFWPRIKESKKKGQPAKAAPRLVFCSCDSKPLFL
jgi:hypothetical protein